MKKTFSIVFVTAFLLGSCIKDIGPGLIDFGHGHGNNSDASVALDWYKLQQRFLLERNSALNTIYLPYIGIALYESVRYSTKNSISLSEKLYQMPAMPAKENTNAYNWQVSANAAMASMVRLLFTGLTPANNASIDSLENLYNQKLTNSCVYGMFSRSQAFGRSIATAVYNWYLTDKTNTTNTGYMPPVFPGAWVPTPPAFANGINPYVGSGRVFVEADATLLAPPFPAMYSESPECDFYKIAKNDYDVSKTLTTDQKNIALFWVDQGNGLGVTPDGHNIAVIIQACEQTKADLAQTAEALAKSTIADRDAVIVCFRSKYTYNVLRPVTYIRKFIDKDWLPFIPTPPHPEYPAAHAMVTGAVMEAATKVLGEHVTVTDHTYDFRGWAPRTYTTLIAAGEEAGISRLYGGIHYLTSIEEGLALSKIIGKRIGALKLHY